MLSVIGFLVILGPLVVVHEFGHYVFARIFNVKAEIFSIGFGPRLWGRQCGETELRVSAFPLGGYVKLLGEEAEGELSAEDQKRSLQKQVPWKRFFIFFGGPFFNLLFAVVVFMAILLIGEPQLASVAGRVVHGSIAEKAGMRSGDIITAVNGKPVKRFDEVLLGINERPGQQVIFTVKGLTKGSPDSAPREVSIATSVEKGFSIYGESTPVGDINGLLPHARAMQVGVSDSASQAGKAGVKTGDKITEINGQSISNWEEFEDRYQKLPAGATFSLRFEKLAEPINFTKPANTQGLGADLGVHSSELFVDKTVPKSPAEAAGILSGDRLVSIGPNRFESFFDLKDAVQSFGERDGKVTVAWERDGKMMTAVITPTATVVRDPLLNKVTQFSIGVWPMLVWAEPATVVERIWNPFKLVYMATERTVVFSWRNLVSIRKMITGDVSISTLGGPILIGKIAGESIARGLIAFLTTMAILSVGLGILNILPIPVLDGGHLMLLGIEAIRGKPLSIRQMEVIQQVGLSLILLLMVIVIRNDIIRLPFFE